GALRAGRVGSHARAELRRPDVWRVADRRRGRSCGRAARGAGAGADTGGGTNRPHRRGARGRDRGRLIVAAIPPIPEYRALTPGALDALERAVRERRRVALRRRGTEY